MAKYCENHGCSVRRHCEHAKAYGVNRKLFHGQGYDKQTCQNYEPVSDNPKIPNTVFFGGVRG